VKCHKLICLYCEHWDYFVVAAKLELTPHKKTDFSKNIDLQVSIDLLK
jgi:hypothetical protein